MRVEEWRPAVYTGAKDVNWQTLVRATDSAQTEGLT